MNNELLEKGPDMQDTPEENSYQRYQDLGGVINETDYDSALSRLKEAYISDKTLIAQAENIARFAGIELQSDEDASDPRVILYGILRRDVRSEGVKYHHDQMSDQKIFMEALRMLGDVESADKMVKAYLNISFDYGGDGK
jgi:hypothetical protein